MGLATAVLATIVVVAGVAVLLVPPVIDQTEALIGGLPQTLTKIQNVLAGWAQQYPVLDRTELADPSSGLVASFVNDAVSFVRGAFLGTLRGGGKLFIESASVVVMALYLTSQPTVYRNGLLSLVAPGHRPIAVRILQDLSATLKAWVVGQLIAMAVLALLTALGLWILGVPSWLAFFGTLISTLLPALFMVATGDWVKVVLVLLLGVLVHIFEANVVVPRIMQRKVELPPVLTIASVLIMGALLGAIGLIVAVPILCVTMVLVRHILQAEIYGDPTRSQPAVLRSTERRTGVDRRVAQSV